MQCSPSLLIFTGHGGHILLDNRVSFDPPDRQLSNVMLIRHKHGGFLGSDVAIEIGVLEAGHGQRYEGRSSAVA